MATTVLDKFVTIFGYDTDLTGIKKAEKGLTDFKTAAFKIASTVGAVIGGGFLLNKIADAADETLKFADSVGVAVESLDALEFATQRQGGSVSGLRTSLENLNKIIGESSRGISEAGIVLGRYGVSVRNQGGSLKTADQLLLSLNQRFQGLTKAQQFDLATKAGIDPSTIVLLQTAPDLLASLTAEAREYGVLTRKDAETAAEFNDRLTNLTQVLQSIGHSIGAMVMKPLIQFFDALVKGIQIVRDNSRFVKVLMVILGGLALAWGAVKAQALLANAAMFAIPIAIGLLITAIALLAEDFYAFFTGAPSVIGDLVNKWPALGTVIYGVRDAIVYLAGGFVDLFNTAVSYLSRLGQAILNLPKTAVAGLKALSKFFNSLVLDPIGTVLGLFDKIKARFAAGIFGSADKITKPFRGISDSVRKFLLDPLGKVIEIFDNIKRKLTGPLASLARKIGIDFGEEVQAQSPVAAAAAAPQVPNTTNTNSISIAKVEVMANNGDSREIAQNLNTELRDQMQHAVRDFDSPIRR